MNVCFILWYIHKMECNSAIKEMKYLCQMLLHGWTLKIYWVKKSDTKGCILYESFCMKCPELSNCRDRKQILGCPLWGGGGKNGNDYLKKTEFFIWDGVVACTTLVIILQFANIWNQHFQLTHCYVSITSPNKAGKNQSKLKKLETTEMQ